MSEERLQKFLSRAGVASRRAAEELIRAGRVRVKGRVVTEMGTKVDPDREVVLLDDRPVSAAAPPLTVVLHKPYGYICTRRDPQGRRLVMDLLPEDLRGRLYPVGRLDYDATGLLLLSSDGELAHRLTVTGQVERRALTELRAGVSIDDRQVAAEVEVIKRQEDKTVLELTVWEGRHHLVKRLLEKIGHPVLKLKRIGFGPLRLGRLARASYRLLTAPEMAALRQIVGLK